MSPKPAAHENPLIPNARLRQMYRAILRAHLLGQALPPAQRALTATREAALVSTALDLGPRDLVLDAFSNPVLDLLRGTQSKNKQAGSKTPGAPPTRSLGGFAGEMSRRILADAGSPFRLPSPSNPSARIHAALGAAAALKSAAALAKASARKSKTSAHDSAVVLACALPSEVPAETWKSALAFAAEHDLPAIFVVLPPAGQRKSRSAKPADLRAIAHRAHVPAMPVDATDPVALYRVAQESIGHARIGGGPALIECVAFPSPASRKSPALMHLEQYILQRGIATQSWFDRESSSFAQQLLQLKSASK